MTHLSESEFVELAENEGALDSRRVAHVETCASCREQVDGLRAILRDTKAVEVPDPSPLFWEHFQARVREQAAETPGFAWGWSGVRGLVPFAAAAALVVAVFSGVLLVRAVRDGQPGASLVAGRSAIAPAVAAPARPDATPDAENAEVWAVLTAAASTVEFEDAHDVGMHVHPAALDHAVQDLTAAELTELGRLLQTELKHASN